MTPGTQATQAAPAIEFDGQLRASEFLLKCFMSSSPTVLIPHLFSIETIKASSLMNAYISDGASEGSDPHIVYSFLVTLVKADVLIAVSPHC